MTWLNPFALAGLVALAIPILVHLFGRRSARRQRFPSLRLLRLSHPTPATRSRPSDILLLVVRCFVILAAALALAQPRWTSAGGAGDTRVPVRAILVDTSASMRRLTSDGIDAVERARSLAQRMLDSARGGLVVETGRPGANIAGAASWLSGRAGLRELVVVSDFQEGAVRDGNLAPIPDGIGVRMMRVEAVVTPEADSRGRGALESDGVSVEPEPDGTRATWSALANPDSSRVEVLVADEDSAAARAMMRAVADGFPEFFAGSRKIRVVFPGYPDARMLAGQVVPLSSSWQGDVMMAVRRSDLLARVRSAGERSDACEGNGAELLDAGRLVIGTIAAGEREQDVVIFSCASAGSPSGTALLAAVSSAAATAVDFGEREPAVVPDETLRRWERPATEVAPLGREETSPDGRWLWLVAILLLLFEEWLRRRTVRAATVAAIEVARERVA